MMYNTDSIKHIIMYDPPKAGEVLVVEDEVETSNTTHKQSFISVVVQQVPT